MGLAERQGSAWLRLATEQAKINTASRWEKVYLDGWQRAWMAQAVSSLNRVTSKVGCRLLLLRLYRGIADKQSARQIRGEGTACKDDAALQG